MKVLRFFTATEKKVESYQRTKRSFDLAECTKHPDILEKACDKRLNLAGTCKQSNVNKILKEGNKSPDSRHHGLKVCPKPSLQSRLSSPNRTRTTPILFSSLLSEKIADENPLRSVIVLSSKKFDSSIKSKYSEPVLARLIWECESVRTLDDYKKLCAVCDQLVSKYALRVSLGLVYLQNTQLREYVETLFMMASQCFLELTQQVHEGRKKKKKSRDEEGTERSQSGLSSLEEPLSTNIFIKRQPQRHIQSLSHGLVALSLLHLLTTLFADVSIDFATEMSTQRSFTLSLAHLIVEATTYYAVTYFKNKTVVPEAAAYSTINHTTIHTNPLSFSPKFSLIDNSSVFENNVHDDSLNCVQNNDFPSHGYSPSSPVKADAAVASPIVSDLHETNNTAIPRLFSSSAVANNSSLIPLPCNITEDFKSGLNMSRKNEKTDSSATSFLSQHTHTPPQRDAEELFATSPNDKKSEHLFYDFVNATASPVDIFSSQHHSSLEEADKIDTPVIHQDNSISVPIDNTIFFPTPHSEKPRDYPTHPCSNKIFDSKNSDCIKQTNDETKKENSGGSENLSVSENFSCLRKNVKKPTIEVLNKAENNLNASVVTEVNNCSTYSDPVSKRPTTKTEKLKEIVVETVEISKTKGIENTFEPTGAHGDKTCFQTLQENNRLICENYSFPVSINEQENFCNAPSTLHQQTRQSENSNNTIENSNQTKKLSDVCYRDILLKKECMAVHSKVNNISEQETSPTLSCSQQQKLGTCCNSDSCHCITGQEDFLSPKESDSVIIPSSSKLASDEDNSGTNQSKSLLRFLMLEKLNKSMGVFLFGSLYVDIAQVPEIQEKLLIIFEYISDPQNDKNELLLLDILSNWLEAVTHCSSIYDIIVESVPLCVALLRMLAKATRLAKVHNKTQLVPFLSFSSEVVQNNVMVYGSEQKSNRVKMLHTSLSSNALAKSFFPVDWTGAGKGTEQLFQNTPPAKSVSNNGNNTPPAGGGQLVTEDEADKSKSKKQQTHGFFSFWKNTKKKVIARLRRPSQFESMFSSLTSRRFSQENSKQQERKASSNARIDANNTLVLSKLDQLRTVALILLPRLASSCEVHAIHSTVEKSFSHSMTIRERALQSSAATLNNHRLRGLPGTTSGSTRWFLRKSPKQSRSFNRFRKLLSTEGSVSSCSFSTLVALRTCADSVSYVTKTLLEDVTHDNQLFVSNEDESFDDELSIEQIILRLEYRGLLLQESTAPPQSMLVMFKFRELNRCAQCNKHCFSHSTLKAASQQIMCPNCQLVRYCSRACQRKTEGFHQPICNLLRKRLWEGNNYAAGKTFI